MCSVTQPCPTLCDPMNYCLPGSSVHGIFQGGILEWIVIYFLFQGIFPTQGLNPLLSHLLHGQADTLSLHHLGCTTYPILYIKVTMIMQKFRNALNF